MAKIKIITDSSSDIPQDLLDKYNITMLPMGIVIGETVYYDRVNIDSREYCKMLKELEEIPTTTMVPIQLMREEFVRNAEEYDHQIFITISSKASGTYSTANVVKSEIEEIKGKPSNITIIDSMSFSMVFGKVVVTIAKMAQDGASFDEIMQAYQDEQIKSSAYFMVDDLKHLQKGGRIKPGIAIVGSLLGIKPLLTVSDGLVDSIGKERGKIKALEKISDMMIAELGDTQKATVWIANGYADEDVKNVIEIIKSKAQIKEIIEYNLGACISTHAGAGLVGLIFTKDN